jgi:hypothetical protein
MSAVSSGCVHGCDLANGHSNPHVITEQKHVFMVKWFSDYTQQSVVTLSKQH